jgi:diguanylate cyclase (GGDEF)-like protein
MEAQEQFSILLVDDDLTVIRVLNRILSNFTPVRFADTGRLALKLARDSAPDLVLLDVDMPEFSGFEVCKAFKADPALREVPIIFITSHESSQLEAKGIQLGASDFISKPPHAPLVLARVRTYQRLKTLSETVRSAVKIDFLTGALTRRQLEKALTQEWLRSQRSAAPLALLLADIEAFAAYNVAFGDEKGDECLKSVAEALRSAAQRPGDLLGRYGGGQFALLLPNTAAEGASKVARRAIDGVAALQLPHAKSAGFDRVMLSVAGGCFTSSRTTGENAAAVPNDLITVAETALRSARRPGGRQANVMDLGGQADLPSAGNRVLTP